MVVLVGVPAPFRVVDSSTKRSPVGTMCAVSLRSKVQRDDIAEIQTANGRPGRHLYAHTMESGAGQTDSHLSPNRKGNPGAMHQSEDSSTGSRFLRTLVLVRLSLMDRLESNIMIKAYPDVIFCHRALWKMGIRHCGVRLANMMWDFKDKKGVLIDFDLAKLVSHSNLTAQNEINSTLSFLALDLPSIQGMKGQVAPLYRHELKSFTWVFTYLWYGPADFAATCRDQGRHMCDAPIKHELLRSFLPYTWDHVAQNVDERRLARANAASPSLGSSDPIGSVFAVDQEHDDKRRRFGNPVIAHGVGSSRAVKLRMKKHGVPTSPTCRGKSGQRPLSPVQVTSTFGVVNPGDSIGKKNGTSISGDVSGKKAREVPKRVPSNGIPKVRAAKKVPQASTAGTTDQ